jgi:membrane fusion protein (multidrug efflux system)
MLNKRTLKPYTLFLPFAALLTTIAFSNCNSQASNEGLETNKLLNLPVYEVDTGTATTVKDYLGTIEGKVNVEIRPQVEGILEKIFIDEGQYVEEGQKLFKVNELPYREALKNAIAEAQVEKAKEKNARQEVESLKPLVEHEVISDVQYSTAQSKYEVASASVAKAATAVATAKIELDFTTIKAPSSGYIGRIPKRIGNLISKGDSQPLTILSDTKEVYVYFSMSESDFLYFTKNTKKRDSTGTASGQGMIPYVRLILADGTEYAEKGLVDAVDGQVNSTTGSISLRATFPNPDDILRHGNTGTLKMEERQTGVLMVPKLAITELQDKTFVYTVDEQNRVKMQDIEVDGISGDNYIVKSGLKPSDRVILAGIDQLKEGQRIQPRLQKSAKL